MKKMLAVLCVLLVGISAVDAATIAFSDPSQSGTMPLFSIDLVNDLITAGWDDGKMGLNLNVDNALAAADAFFTMTPLTYVGGITGGYTSGGTIKFYADNADPLNDAPIFQIDFQQAYVNVYGIGGSNIALLAADGVSFSGPLVTVLPGYQIIDETFAFSFANQLPVNGSASKGYTATASFTSSYGVIVPEPATIGFLALGTLLACRRRR